MPEISRFFGIIIRMYFDDHPPPHFHAIYGNSEAQVAIDPILVLEGDLPPPGSFDGDRMGCITPTRVDGKLATITREPGSAKDPTVGLGGSYVSSNYTGTLYPRLLAGTDFC